MTTPQVRINPEDGRVAQLLLLDGGDLGPDAQRWVCLTAPAGRITVGILDEADVATWHPVNAPHLPTPPAPTQYAIEYCGDQQGDGRMVERWWFYICDQCTIRDKTLVRVFKDKAERREWVKDHQATTSHTGNWTAMHCMPLDDDDQLQRNLDSVWGRYLESQQQGRS